MFDLPETKAFMDNIHGYIRIPKIFIKHIIDTREFQRLRNIDQTGMKILFPAGKHDRFSHSLGVFHLGSIAVDALLKNFYDDSHWKIKSDRRVRDVFWAKNKILFLIACLLHDIGHAPFSHSLERFYGDGKNYDLEAFLHLDVTNETEINLLNKSKEHEKMSAFLILRENSVWQYRIEQILNDLKKVPYPKYAAESDEEYRTIPPAVDSMGLDDDIQFVARMILGVKYSDYSPERQMQNCFIELLNGNFDVDKLDYTVRDTKMSGIGNITLDIERLLTSLTIIPTTVYINWPTINIDTKEETIIITQISLKESNTIIIKGKIDKPIVLFNCKVKFCPQTKITLKPVYSETKAGINTDGADFLNNSNSSIALQGKILKRGIEFTGIGTLKDGCLELTNAILLNKECKITFDEDHSYFLDFDSLPSEGASEISISKGGKLLGKDSIKFSGCLSGDVERLEILSDELSKTGELPSPNRYTGFSIGFKKQAINLISNVSDARNYLYLWIYSHHKVIYYANYLIVELARLSTPKQNDGKTLSDMMYNMMTDKNKTHILDEDFIHTQIRTAYLRFNPKKYYRLYWEFSTRVYRASLYKSLAEFDLLFDCFNDKKLEKMRKHLDKISSIRLENEKTEKASNDKRIEIYIGLHKYGEIKVEFLKEMVYKEIDLSLVLDDIIWVSSNPSLKRPSPASIYIMFGNKENAHITTMDRLPILKLEDIKIEQKYYFYLYYKQKSKKTLEKYGINNNVELKKVIHEAFVDYMKEKLKNIE